MIGEYKSTLDLKGRMNIPTKLRDELGVSFVIAKPLDGAFCITVYPVESWNRLVETIKTLPQTKTSEIRRYLFGSAYEVEPDKQGRVLIPVPLREYAGLEGETVVVGLEDKTEIWSKTAWDNKNNTVDTLELAKIAMELEI